jgi:hypothetical protein
MVLVYRTRKDLGYRLGDGSTLRIIFNATFFSDGPSWNEGSIKEHVSTDWGFRKGLPFGEVIDRFSTLENFLTILTNHDANLGWPTLKSWDGVSYTYYFRKNESQEQALDWTNCPVLFPEIEDDFGDIFRTWLEKQPAYGPGFHLYTGARRASGLYVEHRFANFVWGLESFHRTKYAPDADSAALRKRDRIIASVAEGDRRWLAGKLAFASEPALESRLLALFRELPVVFDARELRRFAHECGVCRNELSHFGGKRTGPDYRGWVLKLDRYSDVLSYLYHAIILAEIGVPAQLVARWLVDGAAASRFNWSLQQLGMSKPTRRPMPH